MIAGEAMQIDTWNRAEMNLTGSRFVPGPYPKNVLAPKTGPDAVYSGLLECPLTTRVEVQPDKGCGDFSPGSAPFGQGSGYYRYHPGNAPGPGNCSAPARAWGAPQPSCVEWGYIDKNRCPAQPRGDLLAQRNPTCDIRTYTGGLQTCLHGAHTASKRPIPIDGHQRAVARGFLTFALLWSAGWHLLDAEQEIPWADQPLVYYKKFR